jgi:hypothetical protein
MDTKKRTTRVSENTTRRLKMEPKRRLSKEYVNKISQYLFGAPNPPLHCEYLIDMYSAYDTRKSFLPWTDLENKTLSVIASQCKLLMKVKHHAGLRISYLLSIEAMFRSLDELIDHEKELH